MIKFGENNKVENIGILTKAEARAYVDFLDYEWDRHSRSITEALSEIGLIGMWTKDKKYDKAMELFYQSAIQRHEEDIKAIDVLVTTLKGFYGI